MTPLQASPGAEDGITRLLDQYLPWLIRDEVFATHYFATERRLAQGWKIHVSATPWSAPAVLDRVLPIIMEFGVGCKIVYSQPLLLMLNNGVYGRSQVGKFITLYPPGDDQAVRLAVALHEATDGMRGPSVPSDRALRPRSLVHYRYGVFGRSAGGRGQARSDGGPPDAVACLLDHAGRVVPDRREIFYTPPDDVVDPFEATGAYVPPEPRRVPFGGRYFIVGALAASTYGGVYRAIDLAGSPPRMCVLKEYWRDSGGDSSGRMAADWGRNEAEFLTRWDHDPIFPRCFDCFELDDNLYTALEYVEGQSLAVEIEKRRSAGGEFSVNEVLSIAESTGRALAHLHDVGVIYRDFNPSNVVVTPDGACRLIDFGIAHESNSDAPAIGFGTLDFCSPQQWAGENAPAAHDDVFSWGAVMHFLLSGRAPAPGTRPQAAPMQPVERAPLGGVCSRVPAKLADVIDKAVAWDASDRYPSMAAALEELLNASAGLDLRRTGIPEPARTWTAAGAGTVAEPLGLASSIADELCRVAIMRDGGACWAGRDTNTGRTFCGPDLYHGTAGVALFLAEFARIADSAPCKALAKDAASWLAGPVWASGRAEPGLHCGESGVGWFFIRLAQAVCEPGYLAAAELRARRLRGVSFEALDLVHGVAGLVIFLTRLAQATAKCAYLDDALALSNALIESARPAPGGAPGTYWQAPTHKAQDPFGRASLGLAHGAAGIGLSLVEVAAASGDKGALAAARNVAELLLAEARPHPQGGWCWRESLDDEATRMQGQCHGAIGVGQFFLRLARIEPDDRYLHAARQAAHTAVREMPDRASPGLCHGLAGDGNFLLDCYQTLGDPYYLDQAKTCGAQLVRHRDAERRDSGSVDAVVPALLVGDAGVGWFYLRLAQSDLGRDAILD